jgi:hypothetical protein
MVTYVGHHPPQPVLPRAPRGHWPLLALGTLIKAPIAGCRFKWLPVLHDPGPAGDRERRITFQGPYGAPIAIRRHNVTTLSETTARGPRWLRSETSSRALPPR